MIKGFIFDFDGTLFDTMAANIHAYGKAFAAAGLHFDADKYTQSFGLRYKEMMDMLAPGTPEHILKKIKDAKAEFYAAATHLVVPNSGLLALLDKVRSDHKTALTTTARAKNVSSILEHFKLPKQTFDTIITGESVEHGKPHPECYNKTIAALGLQPTECCVFEDSDIGVQAARLAGAHVVKVAM